MNPSNQVEGVFFCSGARNQLLLNQFQNFPLYMEVDERIASFKALGLGKSKNKVTIICTTSGTAVAECLPAMIEAYFSEVPLLLVSADRPLSLSHSGAPQTIDHEIITRGFRKDYRDVELSEFHLLDFSMLEYPAHVNVRITTPDEKKSDFSEVIFPHFSSFMEQVKTPLFLFSHETHDLRDLIEKFKNYGYLFYAEVASGAKDLSLIKTEREALKLFQNGFFDGVVRIGHTPMNKLWRLLEGNKRPVYSFDSRGLKGLSYGSVEKVSARELLTHAPFWGSLRHQGQSTFQDESLIRLESLCSKYPHSEVSLMKALHDAIPEGSKIYLGNSLPIRYFELVQTKKFQIMANRGVNGIDGQLASAQGWGLSTEDTIYCILGDMTLTYDLSSLLNLPANIKCIVINNSGGRIFEVLGLDQRLVMEHHRSFEQICKGFKLSYGRSLQDLSRAQVIELFPDLDESRQFSQEWRS